MNSSQEPSKTKPSLQTQAYLAGYDDGLLDGKATPSRRLNLKELAIFHAWLNTLINFTAILMFAFIGFRVLPILEKQVDQGTIVIPNDRPALTDLP